MRELHAENLRTLTCIFYIGRFECVIARWLGKLCTFCEWFDIFCTWSMRSGTHRNNSKQRLENSTCWSFAAFQMITSKTPRTWSETWSSSRSCSSSQNNTQTMKGEKSWQQQLSLMIICSGCYHLAVWGVDSTMDCAIKPWPRRPANKKGIHVPFVLPAFAQLSRRLLN